jgi:lysozyme
MKQELKRQLTGDEGKKKTVYKDSRGYWTIGIGILVDDRIPGSGLREHEIQYIFNSRVDEVIEEVTRKLPWFQDLDDTRKGVLLNMAFQMGVPKLLEFVTTLRHVKEGNYKMAAFHMLKSRWAEQTPARAKRMADQMETGVWQYSEGT